MNRTYIDMDCVMDTKTVVQIESDGFNAVLTISYKTGKELDKEYKYSGTRVCFHRLIHIITSLYERGNNTKAGFYSQAFESLLSTWYSSTELTHLMGEYQINNSIDLVSTLLKDGAFKTLRVGNS